MSKAKNLAINCSDTAKLLSLQAIVTQETKDLAVGVLELAAEELARLAVIESLYKELKFRMDGLER